MDGDVKGHRERHVDFQKDNAAGTNPSPSDYVPDTAFCNY
jgi:hypothetical protein